MGPERPFQFIVLLCKRKIESRPYILVRLGKRLSSVGRIAGDHVTAVGAKTRRFPLV
jgi:hypothetical protein